VRAVELSNQKGIEVQQVAAGPDIHPVMLSRWRKEYREDRIRPDGRKRVERPMREASLIGRAGRVCRRIPGIERFYERHRNIRLNQPAPTGLNLQWVADLTYIRVGNE